MSRAGFSAAKARAAGWERHGGPSKLSVSYTHPSGWRIQHCGHPTANWPWALYAPDGSMHCTGAVHRQADGSSGNPKHGTAWRRVDEAMDYVARVLRGGIPLREGRFLNQENTGMNAPYVPTITMLGRQRLRPNPQQPRKRFDQKKLEELADSIKEQGVVEPLLVRPLPKAVKGVDHEIVFGERRWRASQVAALDELPCMVRQLTDEEALELQLVENDKREDVHPIEQAEGYRRLRDEFQYGVDQIARKVGRSVSHVQRRLLLCKLVEKVKQACLDDEITVGVAELIARIPDEKLQAEALERVGGKSWRDEPLTVREAREEIDRRLLCRLDDASFDIADATLAPERGPCTTCPHRTGNQRELFGELRDSNNKQVDVCTDSACFKRKQDADWSRKAEEAKAKGLKVLSDREAKKVLQHGSVDRSSGMVELSAYNYDDPKHRTYKALLGKEAKAAVVLARDERGRVHELIDASEARKLIKEKHPELAKKEAANSVDQAEAKRRRAVAVHNAAVKSAMDDLVLKVEATPGDFPEGFYAVVCECAIRNAHHECLKRIIQRRGLGEARDMKAGAVRSMRRSDSATELLLREMLTMSWAEQGALALELLVTERAYAATYMGSGDWGKDLRAACDVFDVDWDAHLKKSREDHAPKKKAAAKKKPAAAPKKKAAKKGAAS